MTIVRVQMEKKKGGLWAALLGLMGGFAAALIG